MFPYAPCVEWFVLLLFLRLWQRHLKKLWHKLSERVEVEWSLEPGIQYICMCKKQVKNASAFGLLFLLLLVSLVLANLCGEIFCVRLKETHFVHLLTSRSVIFFRFLDLYLKLEKLLYYYKNNTSKSSKKRLWSCLTVFLLYQSIKKFRNPSEKNQRRISFYRESYSNFSRGTRN